MTRGKMPVHPNIIAAVAISLSGDAKTYAQLISEAHEITGQPVSKTQVRRSIAYIRRATGHVERTEAFSRSGRTPAEAINCLRKLAYSLSPEVASSK